jgi:hypothetical protein
VGVLMIIAVVVLAGICFAQWLMIARVKDENVKLDETLVYWRNSSKRMMVELCQTNEKLLEANEKLEKANKKLDQWEHDSAATLIRQMWRH